jgi:hypothetical protein
VVPGELKNGTAPLEDLVFERDISIPGLYRAKIEEADLAAEKENGFKVKKIGSR